MTGNTPTDHGQRAEASPSVDTFPDRTDWLAFGVTAMAAFVVYCFTLAPDVTLGFSGIFSTGAMYGGVPHPPGYPLWMCYAWAFTKLLPFGNIAWRVAVSSAAATALACGLIALLVSRESASLLEQLVRGQALAPSEQKWTRLASGWAAGLIFGFSGAVWQRAVIADAWPLTLFLLVSFLCLMRRWIYSPERKRLLLAALFVYGAGLTNSHALIALAPAVPVLVLAGDKRLGRDFFLVFTLMLVTAIVQFARTSTLLYAFVRGGDFFFVAMILLAAVALSSAVVLIFKTHAAFTEWKALLGAGAAMLLGLSLYLYVPLASMTNPPMNWGYARTAGGFVHTLTRGQYEMVRPAPNATQLGRQMIAYVVTVGRDFGSIFVLPVLLLPFVWRKLRPLERNWLMALVAVYGCFAFLLIAILNPGIDPKAQSLARVFYSLSYVLLSLWLGCGVTVAIALWGNSSHRPGATPAVG